MWGDQTTSLIQSLTDLFFLRFFLLGVRLLLLSGDGGEYQYCQPYYVLVSMRLWYSSPLPLLRSFVRPLVECSLSLGFLEVREALVCYQKVEVLMWERYQGQVCLASWSVQWLFAGGRLISLRR